jgi:hypothetical protein
MHVHRYCKGLCQSLGAGKELSRMAAAAF